MNASVSCLEVFIHLDFANRIFLYPTVLIAAVHQSDRFTIKLFLASLFVLREASLREFSWAGKLDLTARPRCCVERIVVFVDA